MAYTMIHGYLKDLYIKYDPSHCIYAGGDYLKETRDWGDRFLHIHLKGSLKIDNERFDDPPAGMDQTNWGAFAVFERQKPWVKKAHVIIHYGKPIYPAQLPKEERKFLGAKVQKIIEEMLVEDKHLV